MPTFHIHNFGCRATQADAASIEAQLLASGCVWTNEPARAEFVVVNTCTVTSAADQQARQAIQEIARRNPAARIIVTGCYAQRAPEEIAALPSVTHVVGNSHRMEVTRIVAQPNPTSAMPSNFLSLDMLAPGAKLIENAARFEEGLDGLDARVKILVGDIFAEQETMSAARAAGHTRPTLKIQDGCDNRCAYCVIPFVRGRSRSLPPAAVIAELQRLAAEGTQEVVLSGINLGSYGRDLAPRVELPDLLRSILDETPIARVRISSIEPMDVTRDLVELFAAGNRLAPHFHMPLQSGSDRILAAMHRWYRAAHYQEHVKLIHDLLPDAAIGADVIAGFPGETEEDHRRTCEFVEALPFSYLHIFSFSVRPGTKGATLPGQLDPAAIRRRARELRAIAEHKKTEFRAKCRENAMRVLTLETARDEAAQGWTRAISGNYLDLRVRGNWPANRWLDVRVTANSPNRLEAVCTTGSQLHQ